jgi:hypothetical protein
MDSLMNLIKPEIVAEPIANRVLVSIETGAEKEGFGIAAVLREVGLRIELALDGQRTAECGWHLEVRAESPVFILTELVSGKKLEVQTTDEVIALLLSKGS